MAERNSACRPFPGKGTTSNWHAVPDAHALLASVPRLVLDAGEPISFETIAGEVPSPLSPAPPMRGKACRQIGRGADPRPGLSAGAIR